MKIGLKSGILIGTASLGFGVGAVHGFETASAHIEAVSAEATANYFNQDGMTPDTVTLQQERADDFSDIRDWALIMASADTVIAAALLGTAIRGRKEGLFQ